MVVKKVGCVIAYHKGHTNYGTSLVGYALIKEIKNLGYDVEVINYVKQLPFWEKIAWAINAIRCDGFNFISERFIGAKNIKNNPTYKNRNIRAKFVVNEPSCNTRYSNKEGHNRLKEIAIM